MILDIPYNFHWIEAGQAARAAQAYAGFLHSFLRAHDIRAIINLRGCNPAQAWWRNEVRICGASGIVHRDAKLNSRQLPTRSMLVDLLDAFDVVPRPFLLKCSGGQDRTSLAAALFLLHAGDWAALPQAQAQFAPWPYLHWPRRNQRWLQLFPVFAGERSGRAPLREWIGRGYAAPDFRCWLQARGEGRAFEGLYDAHGSASRD